MFKVFDTKEKYWLHKDVYLSQDEELFMIKRSLFGLVKTPVMLDGERYIYHESINLLDKNGQEIYEGDYLLANVDEDKTVVGLVAYVRELSAYVILCEDSNEFFTLGSETTEFIQVIGNAFDGYEVVLDDEQTLYKPAV
jgi:hypothetical protein